MSPTPQHQAIYRRWRAQTFGQIVGQGAVVETLRNAVRTNRVSHGVLLVGPRGTGKTSLARILAKAINCTQLVDGEPCDACPSCVAIREGRTLDVYEIDAASHRGIDAIREIRERIQYPPGELSHKVYILDEAHQITKDAWGALLKTLEEPPDFVNFMFASTEPSGFPAAILSRLQRFDLRRLTVPEIAGKMRMILEADGRTAEPEAIDLIARLAAGGMRDAESMLDQLLATDAETLTADRVRDVLGLVEEETVEAFLGALISGEPMAGIVLLDGLEERGRDLRAFTEQAIERLRVALVASLGRGSPGGLAAAGPTTLAAAARRLAPSIQPIPVRAVCASSSSLRCWRGPMSAHSPCPNSRQRLHGRPSPNDPLHPRRRPRRLPPLWLLRSRRRLKPRARLPAPLMSPTLFKRPVPSSPRRQLRRSRRHSPRRQLRRHLRLRLPRRRQRSRRQPPHRRPAPGPPYSCCSNAGPR